MGTPGVCEPRIMSMIMWVMSKRRLRRWMDSSWAESELGSEG